MQGIWTTISQPPLGESFSQLAVQIMFVLNYCQMQKAQPKIITFKYYLEKIPLLQELIIEKVSNDQIELLYVLCIIMYYVLCQKLKH